jgi:hypothetical protein
MKRLSLAVAVSAFALAPLAASAAQQTTATQSEFKSSVKARPMNHQIVRSESSRDATTGAASSRMPR